jgi:hypothetical protein
MLPLWVIVLGLATVAANVHGNSYEPAQDVGLATFRSVVRTTLEQQCLSCHSGDEPKGKLDLSRRDRFLSGGESGPVVELDNPAASLILEKLESGEMPPKHPLAPDDVAAFRRWLEAGAPYEGEPLSRKQPGRDWWSLQPVGRPVPPNARAKEWARTPVDAFVLEKLEEADLAPATEADRATWLRRVSLDLTGLPPSPEDVATFGKDRATDAYERIVDRLLASPAYGERWGRHWLDAARFGESHGYETNQLRPTAWPYRDYVIRAFNEDMPFARFVLEQVAGDQEPGADWLAQSATGFLVGGLHDVVGNQTVEGMRQQRADDLDDMITATGAVFLGMSLGCARCHDHKFDPISHRDYHALKAVLAGVRHEERELPAPDVEERRWLRGVQQVELARVEAELDQLEPMARPDLGTSARAAVTARRNLERFAPVVAHAVRFTVQATNTGIEPCLDELEIWTSESEPRNVALDSAGGVPSASSTYPASKIHRLEHVNDGRYGNSRSWISAAPGKGWVAIELARPELIDRIVWGRDRDEAYKDRLPTEYYIEITDATGQWHVVASSADRVPWSAGASAPAQAPTGSSEELARLEALRTRAAELRASLAGLGDTIRVYAGTFRDPEPIKLLRRGDVMAEGDDVAPGFVESINPRVTLDPGSPEGQRRLALARWISDPENPLAPRVIVNRIWQHHFGQGLVATPADFGVQGEPPSHPALLDWLARRFLDDEGTLKSLHRMIVLSSTYRQSSQGDHRGVEVDAQNRLVWRFAPRRLEAEAVRDAMLAASGRLDRRMGGPGYWIWEPNINYVVVFNPLNDLGPEHWRRMVYQYKPRSQHDPTFGAFDCPDAALVTPKRAVSTTVQQSLNLLNSRFTRVHAAALAERVRGLAGDEIGAQVERAFALTLQRAPDARERSAGVELVREHGLEALARALFNSSEFLYLP